MRISAHALSKRYGSRLVVDDLTFTLAEGKITGFLGPNGSGKSTTMSMMLGLIPAQGNTLFDGKTYPSLPKGPRRIGAYLGPGSFHPKYTAQRHLRISAFTRGIPLRRVRECLDVVGLTSARNIQVNQMSTGMKQRLGIAAAILSQPEVLILDEPANGLDPQSVQWLRTFLQDFARDGGTVLLSSHLINEIAVFADDILVIAQGKMIASEPMDMFLKRQKPTGFKVRTPMCDSFAAALTANKVPHERLSEDVVQIETPSSVRFVQLAVQNDIELIEISPIGSTLEDVFLSVTSDRQDYSTQVPDDVSRGRTSKKSGSSHA